MRHVAWPASHRPTTASAAAAPRVADLRGDPDRLCNAAGVGRRNAAPPRPEAAGIQREHAQPDARQTQRYDLLGAMVEARPESQPAVQPHPLMWWNDQET